MSKAKKSAPRKGKKTGARKGRKGAKTRNVSEYASMSCTRTMDDNGSSFTTKRLYSLMNTSLSQFDRAGLPARAYQHYRIKYIELKIKPNFDNYFAGNPVPTGKPMLYYMIDKAGALPTNISLEGLKQAGAKPRALDEGPLKIGWRPSVLELTLTQGGAAPLSQGSRYQISPWLNCNSNSVDVGVFNPSSVDHLGVYWFVDQPVGGAQPYQVEVEVQFEFKKPVLQGATSTIAARPATFAVLNTSPDGVVGGDDDHLAIAPSS